MNLAVSTRAVNKLRQGSLRLSSRSYSSAAASQKSHLLALRWASPYCPPPLRSYDGCNGVLSNSYRSLTAPISKRANSSVASSIPPASTANAAITTPAEAGKVTSLDDLITSISPLEDGVVEEIGFLKELGLEYGWGPTSLVQWLLEHVHIYSGMPWWGSILATSLIIRLTLFRFTLQSADSAARQRALAPALEPIQARMKAAKAKKDVVALQEGARELRKVMKTAGISPVRLLLPAVAQAVFGYGTFRLLRAMSALPVPGLLEGGLWWLKDLTIPDPVYVLPALVSISMHAYIKIGGESGAQNLNSQYRALFLYLAPAVSFFVMLWQPAALQISFVATTGFAILQNSLLKNSKLREFLGITPLYSKDVIESVNEKGELKRPNKSSVKNIVAAPAYQAPTAQGVLTSAPSGKKHGRKDRKKNNRALSSSSMSPALATVNINRLSPFAPRPSILTTPLLRIRWEARNLVRNTRIAMMEMAGKDTSSLTDPVSAADAATAREGVAGGGRTTNSVEIQRIINPTMRRPVKSKEYHLEASQYETDRQQQMRDQRILKQSRMKEEEDAKRRARGEEGMWN